MIADGGSNIVKRLFGGSINDQSRSVLVMPGDRSCLEAKFHLAEQKGGLSGSIMTYRRLGERLYDHLGFETPVADLSSREILIREIMEGIQLPALKMNGKVRSGMVRHINREIGDLIAGGIRPDLLLSSSGRRKDLGIILKEYMKLLEEKDLIDSEQVPIMIKDLISEGMDLPWDRIGIYLSPSIPRVWSEMIEAVKGRMKDVIIVENPFSTVNSFSGRFTIPPRGIRGRQTITSQENVPLIKENTPFNEVDSIARYLKKRVLEGADIRRCAVVFPWRKRYDTLIKVLFHRYGIPLDMGNDLRLDRIPVVDCLVTLLSLPSSGYRRDDLLKVFSMGLIDTGNLDWRDLEKISRKGFILGGGKDPATNWVDDLLAFSLDEEISGNDRRVSEKWAGYLDKFLERVKRFSKGRMSVADRCRMIGEIVRFTGIDRTISRLTDDDNDRRGMDRFMISVRSLRRRGAFLNIGPVGHSRFMEMLLSELEKEKITTGASKGGIQVLGLQGAVGIPFDLCIIGGCTSNQLPISRGGFRIIPAKERLKLGMAEVEGRRDDLEQMAMVMNSSREVVLSYHTEDAGRPVSISSMIDGLQFSEIGRTGGFLSTVDLIKRIGELDDPALDLYDRREGDVDPMMYDQHSILGKLPKEIATRVTRGLNGRKKRCSAGPNDHRGTIYNEDSITEIRDRFGQNHVWSASRLETYRECPYAFFARYVIGIREREDLEPGVPPEKKGLMFHAIADSFYTRWLDLGRSRLRAAELDQAWILMKSIAEEELARYHYSGPYWDALKDQLLGSDGEEGLLLEFLKVESRYKGAFRVHGTEVKFGPFLGEKPVWINSAGEEDGFLLQGSIDRADRMRTDKGDLFYIWDYKTGSRDVPEESLQVPLYLAALRKMHPDVLSGGGGYYYIRRKGSIRRDPVHGKRIWEGEDDIKKELDNVSARIKDDIHTSLEMIDSIRCGLFGPILSCTTRFCPFIDMCRRREKQ